MERRTGRLHLGRFDHGKWRKTNGTRTSGDVDPEAWKHGITRRSGSNKRKTVTRL